MPGPLKLRSFIRYSPSTGRSQKEHQDELQRLLNIHKAETASIREANRRLELRCRGLQDDLVEAKEQLRYLQLTHDSGDHSMQVDTLDSEQNQSRAEGQERHVTQQSPPVDPSDAAYAPHTVDERKDSLNKIDQVDRQDQSSHHPSAAAEIQLSAGMADGGATSPDFGSQSIQDPGTQKEDDSRERYENVIRARQLEDLQSSYLELMDQRETLQDEMNEMIAHLQIERQNWLREKDQLVARTNTVDESSIREEYQQQLHMERYLFVPALFAYFIHTHTYTDHNSGLLFLPKSKSFSITKQILKGKRRHFSKLNPGFSTNSTFS